MSNTEPADRTLDVDGARLHYEVRGQGPVLVFIGNPMGAAGFAPIRALLTEDHTVVTYDPRGIGRSTRDTDGDSTPEVLADDVSRVIAAVTSEPVALFGSSGGAVTGLALVTRHPGLVRTLVAHEPPLIGFLPEDDPAPAGMDEVFAIHLADGPAAAMARFFEVAGFRGGPAQFGPPPTLESLAKDDYFLRHMAGPTVRSAPDVDALRASPTRIAIGVGEASEGQLAHRAATAFASGLGSRTVVFPGDHIGFLLEPEPFAKALRAELSR
ncbi:alpha/beta hydrolase [Umezawaea sp. Da 62-37]|uniref:alpha/beta fold hydrolase n=1 Tax=Umezawaea sp. Da 62-37 TaxID=3075927 RepID=UPI0028F6DC3E|nr:alpha/beta hydrolase [Umezawaea sp. Da 62-37]WNV89477.1 alpha/beta hydrolase [Umezawaea sp. Da 62-37]